MHEAKQHRFNTWVTLTYDDEHLPGRYWTGLTEYKTRKRIYGGTLHKEHIQKFFRAIRKALSSKAARERFDVLFEYKVHAVMGLRPIPQLRYYYAGEYGENWGRPHYHACIFGLEFNDRKHIDTTDQGHNLYTSKTLEKWWPYGRHMISDLTWETAAYTARYIMKKVTGDQAPYYYTVTCEETGEELTLQPEFNDMSRRPGLGKQWYEKYATDVYKQDTSHVRVRGNKTKPPRYYDKLYKKEKPEHYEHIRQQRRKETIKQQHKYTKARLLAEEKITEAKIRSLRQKIEG